MPEHDQDQQAKNSRHLKFASWMAPAVALLTTIAVYISPLVKEIGLKLAGEVSADIYQRWSKTTSDQPAKAKTPRSSDIQTGTIPKVRPSPEQELARCRREIEPARALSEAKLATSKSEFENCKLQFKAKWIFVSETAAEEYCQPQWLIVMANRAGLAAIEGRCPARPPSR